MRWTVVIPAHTEDLYRAKALDYVVGRYREMGLDVVVDSANHDGEWSKGASVDAAVARTDADGLIVSDGDVFVGNGVLTGAMHAVDVGAPWVQPHSVVVRLGIRDTQRIYRRRPNWDGMSQWQWLRHPAARGGGLVVLSRAAYDASGGIDPRFVGFGGDDVSWARALDTLVGPGVCHSHALWHLWHPPTPRRKGNRGSDANETLAGRYIDSAGQPLRMRLLVAEHRRADRGSV